MHATRSRLLRTAASALTAAGLVIGIAGCVEGPTTAGTAASEPAAQPAPTMAAEPSPGPSAAAGQVPVRDAAPTPQVSRPEPVRIQIKDIGLDLQVVPTGVKDDGEMILPDNHVQAGWYRYGPPPGAPAGSSVLAAHLDTGTESLPISRLDELSPGAEVVVTRADGSTVRYAATGTEQIAKRELNGGELFKREGEPLLRLVTCGGEWMEADEDYADNIVLTATPIP